MGASCSTGVAGNVRLGFADLILDPALMTRPIDRVHVDGRLLPALRDGVSLPRVKVRYLDGRGHFVTGGFQTVEAYRAAGEESIPCSVKPGTWEDAVAEAAQQNHQWDTVGLGRTNRSKRRAVEMLLMVFPQWSDRRIAKDAGVGADLVSDVRTKLQVPDSDTCEHREGADGKVYRVAPRADGPSESAHSGATSDRERSRPSSRPEHLETLNPSWKKFGGQVLPLLTNGIPLPDVMAANQLGLKQLSLVIGRLLDLFDGPIYDDALKRALTLAEKADRLEWLITSIFPELYTEGCTFAESMDVLRDSRFPAGALP